MATYGQSDEMVKYKGYMLVGPPFTVKKGFHQPEGEWTQGRWSSVVAGKIHSSLEYPLFSYDRTEQFIAPEECVGHEVAFFPQHPKLNHHVGDGYDGYRYLATRQDRFGRLWPVYTLEWMLSRVGASTKGLNTEDNDEMMKQIIALLNTGAPFPVAVWDSRMGDAEFQIPAGTEILAQFHKFLYYDWKRKRPAWVPYTAKNDKDEEYIVRDVAFLLRVVAPDPWAGAILRLPVNYAVRHGLDKAGQDQWQSHPKANIDAVMKTLGVAAPDFAKEVDESLLMEVGVGEPANWLGPLEIALQKMATRRLLHITVPDKSIRYKHIQVADDLVIERITGQSSFTPPTLRSIRDLSEAEIAKATKVEEEGIPGFEDFSLTKPVAMEEIHRVTGRVIWANPPNPPTGDMLKYAQTYLVPALAILDIDRGDPFVGWTGEKIRDLATLLGDVTFQTFCSDLAEVEDKGALIEYGHNLLRPDDVSPDEEAGVSSGF